MLASPTRRRSGGHFHAKTIVVFAAILVNNTHPDAMHTGSKIDGKRRRPNVRARLNFGPRLLRGLISRKYLLDKRIGPRFAPHRHRGEFADPVFDRGMRTAVEDVDDRLGHAQAILADRSPEKLTHFELILGQSLVRTGENDAHLPALGRLGRTKPRRKAVAVDAQDMKAVGIAIGTVRNRNAAMIVGTAPP